MMKTFKNQKGITLVALVITIIILLILAGVTIGFAVNGNGLFDKAKQATEEYNNKAIEEQTSLNTLFEMMEEYTNGGGSTPTYTAYTVGQTVTLGGENFYVIEDSDASTSTVKLLAALNVITTDGDANRYKQDASANKLRFDDDSNVYANSEIKGHVDAYKLAVEGRMGAGKTIEEARLMTKEEVEALGEDSSNYTTSGCPAFVNATNYWLGSPDADSTNHEWCVGGSDRVLSDDSVYSDRGCGLRPVIVVLKSNI